MRARVASIALTVIAVATLAACAAQPVEAPASSNPPVAPTAAAACTDAGGTVQPRQPTYNTNDDVSAWVALGDPVAVCAFADGEGDAATRLYADLVTVSSSHPTLAALAYLSKTPVPEGSRGNPAAALCDELGGASSYGPSVNGGGLADPDDAVEPVVAACTFADGSFIDEWAIAYYSGDTVRGIDLATVFRFDPESVPAVFGPVG